MTSKGGRLLGAVLAVAVVLSVASGPALAQDAGDVDLDQVVEGYNANVDEAPGIVRGQLAGQEVELRVGDGSTVAGADTGTAYHFTTAEDGTVTDYGEGEAADPAYRVRTSEDVLVDIIESGESSPADAAAAFERHYDADRIEIAGVGMANALKIEALKLAVWLGRTLGLL